MDQKPAVQSASPSAAGVWNPGLEHAELSDTGMRRTSNQDSLAVLLAGGPDEWNRRGHLFLVADGMGAHAAGELASKLSADIIPLTYQKLVDDPLPVALRKAVEDANQKIHHRGQADPEFHGMGTTTSVLVLGPLGAVAAHVGDSRIYRVRGQWIEQLTFDHSLVWEMWAGGESQPKDVPLFIPRNIITRSLGPSADVQVDVEGPFPVAPGDTYLLCSDGLTGQVTDEEIGQLMRCLPAREAAQALIDLANLRGGPDNITTLVVRVTGLTSAEVGETAPAEPIAPPRAAPVAWGAVAALLVGGLLAMVALGSFVVGLWTLATLAALGAIGCLFSYLRRPRAAGPPPAAPLAAGGRRRQSPYRRASAAAVPEFAAELGKLVDQLRDAATGEDWKIDWPAFDAHREAADRAVERRDPAGAVAAYARAISFMMSELRRQREKRATQLRDDSV